MREEFETFISMLLSREKFPTPDTLIIPVDKRIYVAVRKAEI